MVLRISAGKDRKGLWSACPRVQSIRRSRRNGESVASIARKTHVSEPTVRRYLAKEDLSAVPSARKPRASVIDPYPPVIGQWLAEDRADWRKRRHAATRIWERSGGRAWRGGLPVHGGAGGGVAQA